MQWRRITDGGGSDERALEEVAKNVPLWLAEPGADCAGILSQLSVPQGKLDLLLLERHTEPYHLKATVFESKCKWETTAPGQALYYWSEVVTDASQFDLPGARARVARKRVREFPLEALGGDSAILKALDSPEVATLAGSGSKKAKQLELLVDMEKLSRLRSIKDRQKRHKAARAEFDESKRGQSRPPTRGKDIRPVRYRRLAARVWRADGLTGEGESRRFSVLLGCVTRKHGHKPAPNPPAGLESSSSWSEALEAIRHANPALCVRLAGLLGDDEEGRRWAFVLHAPAVDSRE